jgi:hypothetical protein
VARSAELAILPGGSDLREHVLVHVALGISVIHVDAVDQQDGLREQSARGDGETGVAHVPRIVGAVAAKRTQEWEEVLVDQLKLRARLLPLEKAPAKVSEGCAATVVALGEDAPVERPVELAGFLFGGGLLLVQPLEEEQKGNLLNYLDGVGDASRPETVPKLVDLIANLSG